MPLLGRRAPAHLAWHLPEEDGRSEILGDGNPQPGSGGIAPETEPAGVFRGKHRIRITERMTKSAPMNSAAGLKRCSDSKSETALSMAL